jgi:hypothetical protein
MSDDYEKYLRENGVEPTGETAQSQAIRTLPWWAWTMIVMLGAKAAKYLIATITAPL